MAVFELLGTLVALGLFASAESYHPVMAGGIVLLVLVGLVRWIYRGQLFQRTKLDWPLGLWLLSAMISLWVSYDIPVSLAKLFLILGSIALFYLLNQASFSIRFYAATGLLLTAAISTLYLITGPNVLREVGADNIVALGSISSYLHRLSRQLNLDQAYRIEVDGMLEVAFMIGLGLVAIVRHPSFPGEVLLGKQRDNQRRGLMVTVFAVVLGIIFLGLLLTGSRGSWLAIGLASLGWYLSRLEWTARRRRLAVIVGVTIAGSVLLLVLGLNGSIGRFFGWIERDLNRLRLYLGTSQLIRDYLFTGTGLGTFPMLYSAYILGIDVVFQRHAHNLYLAVWLEQGPLGLVALLWLGVAFFRSYHAWRQDQQASISPGDNDAQHLMASASCWAMAVIFLHGLVDSVHYNSPYLPLIFFPLGLGGFLSFQVAARPGTRVFWPRPVLNRNVAAGSILLFGLLLWGRTPILASWYANLGAVAQAKIELRAYHWPDRIPSLIRAKAELSQPVKLFEQALRLEPGNATARERLELIKIATKQKSKLSARRN